MVGIRQMDQTFNKDHRDAHYFAYRERATIVVSDVQVAAKLWWKPEPPKAKRWPQILGA
ncbi:MAG: hypothetical protein HQ519_09020 [Planctomycetes bacterium]|nr:hypothetical protein [Planctomycetota bacterium]